MWTAAQIDALAPDASSLKAGRQLASPRKWSGLGQDQRSLWGLCQGSGKDPYQAQVDLSQPAFRCSCPSRKFPCKHGLGLMLLWADQPAALTETTPPAWVSDWIAARVQRQQERVARPPDVEAQARRSARREERVNEGVAFLAHWLRDLVRQGLASLPAQPESHWRTASARLIDCQAPGLARQVARIPGLLVETNWQARLLGHLGRLHLLLQAYERLPQLTPELQAEVRGRIGWTQSQEELLARPGLFDQWWVLGWRAIEEEVSTLRTWLWSEHTNQPALLLEFAAGGRPLPPATPCATVLAGELVYFDGATPQRALLKTREALEGARRPRGHSSFESFLQHWAGCLADNPWLEFAPALLEEVVPGYDGHSLVDAQGLSIPLHSGYGGFWRLASISGGLPLTVFGEWDGYALRPLSLWKGERAWTS